MEKNNTASTSKFSICKKIRQALSTNPTFKAINRMKQYYYYQEQPKPQHNKVVNKEGGGGTIPIMFDHSNSMVHGHASKIASPHVGISERKLGKVVTKVESEPKMMGFSTNKSDYNGKHKVVDTRVPLKEQHGVGVVNLEQQQSGKKTTLDINDTFTEYIQRAKNRIRTVSNVGRGQNNTVPDHEANYCGGINNKIGNQNDPFSDFIQQAKKRIRTTSNVGKTSSLKRG